MSEGSNRRTPPGGYPTIALESLRQDLREHAANDELQLSTIRGDVKTLLVDTAGQTVRLEQIQTSLSRRARTEETARTVKTEYVNKRNLKFWGGAIAVVSGGIGAAIHFLLGAG